MDICGPYPISDPGNRYILVITDHFTKWVEAYAIPNQEAVTVAFCFESSSILWLPRHHSHRSRPQLRERPDQGDVRAVENRQADHVGLPPSMQWSD